MYYELAFLILLGAQAIESLPADSKSFDGKGRDDPKTKQLFYAASSSSSIIPAFQLVKTYRTIPTFAVTKPLFNAQQPYPIILQAAPSYKFPIQYNKRVPPIIIPVMMPSSTTTTTTAAPTTTSTTASTTKP
ncbi:hypothetical protein GJ496_004228 [Pomphorhynchus laevis]|nr:hypothetical protein GJ496_004228 [Pomphorhynchus laevis]